MKLIKHFLFFSLTCSLVWFTNCGEEDTNDPVVENNADDDTTDDGSTDPTTYTLTISDSEGGTVTPGSGTFDENIEVEILATPDSSYLFVNWTGSVTSTDNPLSVTMDGDKSITANFVKKQYPLIVNIEGEGTVSEEIVANGRVEDYEEGTLVKLTANPAEGWRFVTWVELDSTQNPLEITITDSLTLTARFVKKQYPLTILTEGEGTISEEIVANGRAEDYDEGTVVKLTANPEKGWRFVTWVELASTQNPLEVTIIDSLTLTARFVKKQYPLTILTDGEGTVSEEIVANGRAEDYDEGTIVKLTANPEEGWRFVTWVELASTQNPLEVTITDSLTLTARFVKKQYPLTILTEGEGTVSEEIVANGRAEDYDEGTIVKLTAIPAEDWRFVTWVELASTQNPLEVTLTDSLTLTARFDVPVKSISITPSSLKLVPGDLGVLTANLLPSNATDTTVTWTSSNEAIATIDQSGIVTTIAAGETTITAVATDGGLEAVASVIVATPVTGLTISPQSKEMNIGSTVSFAASVSPSNASDTTVSWTSSNVAIATIDQAGIVTAIEVGETTITAVTTDGSFEAVASVTVLPTLVTGVTIDPTSIQIYLGSTGSLKANISPTNATDTTVTWTSSNEAIATINQTGVVTSISVGEVTITAFTTDGNFEAVASVTIVPVSVTGVTIVPSSLDVLLSSTGSLTANIAPGNASNKAFTWNSDDTSIATIDENGLVTGVSLGTAIMTATTADGSFTATSTITVKNIASFVAVSLGGVSISQSCVNGSCTTRKSIITVLSNSSNQTIVPTKIVVTQVSSGGLVSTTNLNPNDVTANTAVQVQLDFTTNYGSMYFDWYFTYDGTEYSSRYTYSD